MHINLYNRIFENSRIYNLATTIFSFNNKRIRRYLPGLIKVKPTDSLLDVGCGTGKYDIFSCKYTGIDPNRDYINYAKKHHKGTYIEMDGIDLKFPDNTFDFVTNISTLHHVPDNITEKMIVEMKRVCKKGGQVFIVDIVYPRNFLGYLFFKLDRGNYQKTFEELENFLSKHDFKTVTSDVGKTMHYRWCAFSYKKN